MLGVAFKLEEFVKATAYPRIRGASLTRIRGMEKTRCHAPVSVDVVQTEADGLATRTTNAWLMKTGVFAYSEWQPRRLDRLVVPGAERDIHATSPTTTNAIAPTSAHHGSRQRAQRRPRAPGAPQAGQRVAR